MEEQLYFPWWPREQQLVPMGKQMDIDRIRILLGSADRIRALLARRDAIEEQHDKLTQERVSPLTMN